MMNSTPSPSTHSVLPEAWVERLFQKFEDFYGAKWAAQYGDFPRARVKRTWAEELGGFAGPGEVIARALDAQKASPFPPTLPEFLTLCREAAKRVGNNVPQLGHTLSAEEIERNRKRVADLVASLANAKRMQNAGDRQPA
jgi:hypothetical protein